MTDRQAKALTLPILARIHEQDKFNAVMQAMAMSFAAAAQTFANGRNLIDELVSVQPMQVPTASFMYLDFVHGEPEWKSLLRNWKYYIRHPILLAQELIEIVRDLLPW